MDKIKIVYSKQKMKSPGVYLPSHHLIIIDGTRCESVQKKCLFHELAHARFHRKKKNQYKMCHINRNDMEQEANHCMLDDLIKHFSRQNNVHLNDIDWHNFAKKFKIDYMSVVSFAEKKRSPSSTQEVVL